MIATTVCLCVCLRSSLSAADRASPSAITSPCYQLNRVTMSMILLFMIRERVFSSNKIGVEGGGLPWTAWATHTRAAAVFVLYTDIAIW